MAVIYTCTITVLFLLPSSGLPRVSLPSGSDKIVHFLIHFGLIMLWQFYLFKNTKNRLLQKQIILLLVSALVYGIIIEFLQGALTVSRTADLYDVMANFSGALLAIFVFQKVKHLFAP